MYILGIDSSTDRVSMAVNSDQQLLSKVEYNKNQGYMINIISLINNVLEKAEINLDIVDLFAVNIGPGDFTGTRIGVSVAKTLAWVGSKPIYGIGSLDITALGIFFKNFKKIQKLLGEEKRVIMVPVLDVKRDEVFFSFYKVEENCSGIAAGRKENYNNKDKYFGFAGHTILNITIQNKDYFIDRVSEGYLAESKDFTKKFSGVFVPDNSFCSCILLGGSGLSSYTHIESDNPGISIITDKRSLAPEAFHLNLCAYCNYLKNKQKNPGKIDNKGQGISGTPDYKMDDYALAPLYVREFTPFKAI